MTENEKSWRLGLIGWPLGHSLSPVLHQTALKSLNMPGEYRLYPVAPDTAREEIASLLNQIREGRLDGLNVTVPHKRAVLPFLDHLQPAAESIGAVNTIFLKDGLLTGDNTDAGGFSQDLADFAPYDPERSHNYALVLGAGGAARAVVFALLHSGWSVTVAARRAGQAKTLVDDFTTLSPHLCAAGLDGNLGSLDPDLIVNATPVGTWPEIDASPWPAGLPLPTGARIYDLVYNPPETVIMRAAEKSRGGLGMLVGQAALAFETWTGRPAPRYEMRQAAEQRLAAAIIPTR